MGVVTVRNLNIRNNEMLTSFSGLKLNSVDDIIVAGNASLKSLAGLEKIKLLSGGLLIYHNNSLSSLTGLRHITTVGGSLDIWRNTSLISLDGLSNITFVGAELHIADNPYLVNLTGLERMISIQSLSIENNILINDFCAIFILVTTLRAENKLKNYRVKYNKFNPTVMDFQNGKCFSLE